MNMLARKVEVTGGDEVIRAGEETNRAGQGF